MEFGEEGAGRVSVERVEAADYASVARAGERATSRRSGRSASTTADVPIYETTMELATVDAALAEIFAAPEPPTALLAQSDRIAMRALEWLKGRGLAVPGDVSVVGFDGVPEAAATDPPLTTVQPADRRDRPPGGGDHHRAAPEVRREMLDVELVVRASTAPPAR